MLPQLNTEFFATQIFWLFITFTILYIFVSRYFIPRIGTLVDRREASVKKFLHDAQKIFEKQKELKEKISEILEKARDKSSEIKKIASKDTELELAQNIAKVERDMVKKLAKAEEKLARHKAQLMGEVDTAAQKISEEVLKNLFTEVAFKKKAVN